MHLRRRVSWLPLALSALLIGCGPTKWTPVRWTATSHPVGNPDQIPILTAKPEHYERLGTVSHLHADGDAWQEGGDGTPIIKDLLAECAAMGANALVLLDDTTMADTSIQMTYKGKTYTLPVIGKTETVLGQGVFVTKE